MTTFAFSPLSAEERKAVRQNWARLHATSTASDFILRAFLLGTLLSRHFTPVTNAVKLANGAQPFGGAAAAAASLRSRLDWREPTTRAEVRYAELLGLKPEQLTLPEHAARLNALKEWSKTVTSTKLPEAVK